MVKSAKKALKRYILATLKITLIYKPFWVRIDGGPYKKHFQNFWSKSVSYRPSLYLRYTVRFYPVHRHRHNIVHDFRGNVHSEFSILSKRHVGPTVHTFAVVFALKREFFGLKKMSTF